MAFTSVSGRVEYNTIALVGEETNQVRVMKALCRGDRYVWQTMAGIL